MKSNDDNIILSKTIKFSGSMLDFCKILDARKEYLISYQLLRAATSIGANVKEAQNPESLKDFIHKIKIGLKEAEETEYWLMLCSKRTNLPDSKELLLEIRSIIKILAKIVSTSKKRL